MADMEAYRLLNKSLNFSINFDTNESRTSLKLFETTSEFHNFSVTLKFFFDTVEDSFNLQLTNGQANVFCANYGSTNNNYQIYYKVDEENEKYIYYISNSGFTSLTSATVSISIENGVIDHSSILTESQTEDLGENILSFYSNGTAYNNILSGNSKVSYAENAGSAVGANSASSAGYALTATNLDSAPSFKYDSESNEYTLTVGGRTQSAITLPYSETSSYSTRLGTKSNSYNSIDIQNIKKKTDYFEEDTSGIISCIKVNVIKANRFEVPSDGDGFYGAVSGYMKLSGTTALTGNITPSTTNAVELGSSSKKYKNVYATTFTGALTGNADSATKATNDKNGNDIVNTYLTKQNTEVLGSISIPDDETSSYKIGNSFYIGKYDNQNSIVSNYASHIHSDVMLMLEGSTHNITIDRDSITSSIEITEDSDLRDKIDINDIDDSKTLQFIKSLNPVTYNYNNRSRYNLETEYEEYLKGTKKLSNKSAGFIAQDVERAFKDIYGDETNNTIVSKDNQGDYGLRYSNFTPYLVSAIQEQQKIIETLQTEIQSLKEQINLLNKNEE